MRLKPNVFLVGAQKSATTSVYDWMAQHPDICGPDSVKDTPFFIDDDLYIKGIEWLEGLYRPYYSGERIMLNGCVNYMYFESAIKRIAEYNPDAKIVIILRNPIDRAYSAYLYFRKQNLENRSFLQALKDEKEMIKSENLKELSNKTYASHGLYHKQISSIYNYFDKEKIFVGLYEEVANEPEKVMMELYSFLGVSLDFRPSFEVLNKTGSLRFPLIRNIIFNDSKARRWLLKNVVDRTISYNSKYKLKLFFLNLITLKNLKGGFEPMNDEERKYLVDYYVLETDKLEKLLNKDLSEWKD